MFSLHLPRHHHPCIPLLPLPWRNSSSLCTKRAEVRKCWVHKSWSRSRHIPHRECVLHSTHLHTYTTSRPSSANHLRLSQPLEQLSNQHVTLCDIIELEDDAPKRQKPVTSTTTTFALCRRQRQNASSYQIQLQPDSCLIPIQLRLLFRPGVRRVFWEAAASAHLRHGDDSHR